ncbi:unnamed protein product [Closterium sp. NIES-64]|nr:unnamed protein product [Closterium sp. NIES-64]
MLDVAMHVVGEGDACPTHSFNAPSVSLIGNSPEGLSLWVASTSTPLVNAMEPLCKGIHRLLVRCPIAPADTTPPHKEPQKKQKQQQEQHQEKQEQQRKQQMLLGRQQEQNQKHQPLALNHSYHFVSQTDVAAFLLLHVDALGDVAQRTVEQLGLADPLFPPLAIVSGITVTDALRLMQRAGGVRAVAVVAGTAEEEERMEEGEGRREGRRTGWVRGGRLLGTLSVSDLRGMDADALPHLTSIKVRDFLAHMASLTPEGRCPSITCRMAAPLAEVMALASLVLPAAPVLHICLFLRFFATAVTCAVSMPFREAFAFATIPLFDSAGGTTGFGSSSTGAGTPGVLGGAAAQGPAHQGCWAGQQGEGQGRAQGALGRRGLAAGRWRKGGLRPGMSLGGPLLVDIPCLQRVKECYTEDQLFVRIHGSRAAGWQERRDTGGDGTGPQEIPPCSGLDRVDWLVGRWKGGDTAGWAVGGEERVAAAAQHIDG